MLLVSYEFPPSAEVGAQSCVQIARHLPRYGWEPVVLTVRDRYFAAVDPWAEGEFPGRVVRTRVLPHPLSIYTRLTSRRPAATNGANGNGQGAHAPAPAPRRRGRDWALALLQTPDTYTGWLLPALVSGLRTIRRERIDWLWSSAPYWTSHLVAMLLAGMTGRPWAAHFRDPWAQGRPRLLASALSDRIDTALERMVVRRASVVVCVTEPHAAMFRQAYGLPAERAVTIPNGYDEQEWEALSREPAPDERGAFVITYAGSLYVRRNPRPLFRAVRALIDAGDVEPDRVRIELIGDCELAEGRPVMDIARECGVAECVRLTGRLGRAETQRRVMRASLLLVLAENWTVQIPAKTYEYLRAGRPILALTSEGALADLLRRTDAGWVADPGDDAAVLGAVRAAYDAWKDGGDAPRVDPAVVAGFDRRRLAGRFAEVFERGTR